MTDELTMDPSEMEAQAREAAPEVDPWLQRRMATFGASEIGPLLIALGREYPPNVRKYTVETAAKLFASKAGLRKPKRLGGAAQRGNDVEAELVHAFNQDPLNGWPRVTHASEFPREFLPLLDRVERRLSWTPDGWLRRNGALWVVEVKTDVKGDRTEPDWSWGLQVQAAMAVSGCEHALIIYGPGWAHWNENAKRPPTCWVVERDDDVIAGIRHSCAEGWQRVEEMRQGREEKKP